MGRGAVASFDTLAVGELLSMKLTGLPWRVLGAAERAR
jgi:hypothetical protein